MERQLYLHHTPHKGNSRYYELNFFCSSNATAFLDNPDRDVEDFLGSERIPRWVILLILIPTTAGAGSEITRYAILVRGASKVSIISITSKYLAPQGCSCRHRLHLHYAPKVTAGTGLDAFSHAIEAKRYLLNASIFTELYVL